MEGEERSQTVCICAVETQHVHAQKSTAGSEMSLIILATHCLEFNCKYKASQRPVRKH